MVNTTGKMNETGEKSPDALIGTQLRSVLLSPTLLILLQGEVSGPELACEGPCSLITDRRGKTRCGRGGGRGE